MTHFSAWPSYKLVHEYLRCLKSAIASQRKKATIPRIAQYPQVPHELPDAVFAAIFGDEHPITIVIERFCVVAKHHVPLRRNSRLITIEEKRCVVSSAPLPVAQAASPSSHMPAIHAHPSPTAVSGAATASSAATQPHVMLEDAPPAWALKLLSMCKAEPPTTPPRTFALVASPHPSLRPKRELYFRMDCAKASI